MRWLSLVLSACIAAPAIADAPPTQTTLPAAVSAVAAPAASAATTAPAPATQDGNDVVPELSCARVKAFKDKLHAAVNAALRYPAELKFMPAAGVTFVAYEYQDGRAEDIHITQSSGDRMLDRAAVAAVQNADFASIPPTVGYRRIQDVVIIIFDNSRDDGQKNAKDRLDKQPLSDVCK